MTGSVCPLFRLARARLVAPRSRLGQSFPARPLVPRWLGLRCTAFWVRSDYPCPDHVPAKAEYRHDSSSVTPSLDPVLLLFLSLHRGFVCSLSASCPPSFFVGVMRGFVATVFHLLGHTWAHGPDYRVLRNRFRGLLSAPGFVWALRPLLYSPLVGSIMQYL